MLSRIKKLSIKSAFGILRRGIHLGFCPICDKRTVFFKTGNWNRDHYHCARCLSIPRQRALVQVLGDFRPNWRDLSIHESSPNGATHKKFKLEAKNYTPTQYFLDVKPGGFHNGVRCEDLAEQTFGDAVFDLVITQDVLEHLQDPVASLQEISRTLRPNGIHLFTVPWYSTQETVIRARQSESGVEHLLPPDFHHNPVDDEGALVITEWGRDLVDTIYAACGMTTTIVRIKDRSIGVDAKFIEIFVSRKASLGLEELTTRWQAK